MRRILCINDGATTFSLAERLKATEDLNFRLCNYRLTKCYEKMVAMQPLFLLVLIKKKGGVLI